MSPASPIPSQRPVSLEGAQRDRGAGLGLAQERRRSRPRPPSAGRPAGSSAASPTSVSQQPIEPQRHGQPSGLTGMWPTSPP